MSRLRLLRVVAAALLTASGVAFVIGSQLERDSHHETAAEHALESGTAPSATPTPAVTATVTSTTAAPAVSTPAAAGVLTVTKDPRLSAPEGSKEREAGERAARQAKATPKPTHAAPSQVLTAAPIASTPAPQQEPEGSAAREAAERGAAGEPAVASEASERLFGVNTESTGLVASSVAVTMLLALLVLLAPVRRWLPVVAAAAALFCVAAMVLDVREVAHQNDLGQTRVMTAAMVVAVLHLLAAAVAVRLTAARAEIAGVGV